jgi:methionine-gamma-lyase
MNPQQDPEPRLSTRAIHAGDALNPSRALTPPIFQSSTFRLESCAQGAAFATATAPDSFYTRWGNPTTKQLEAILADLEGAEAALAFSSGMGAISALLFAHLQAGDHLLVNRSVYSGVHELAQKTLPRYGIEASFVEARDPAAVRAAVRPATRLLLVESPTNPTLEIVDLAALGALCRERGVLLVADNTFATPVNQNPLALGADVAVHAVTKGIAGHSDVTAGAICSRREVVERCWPFLTLFGACLSPFEAWLVIRGVKTLPLRVARQNESAAAIAAFLAAHPKVERVHYPGLTGHPGHELARRQMRGFGGMVSFEVRGGKAAGIRFAETLELVQLAVSLGGAETIISHPASMTHGMLDDAALHRAGIAPGLLRLSVGLEDARDLITDLEKALARV